jgi:hypothetical protein
MYGSIIVFDEIEEKKIGESEKGEFIMAGKKYGGTWNLFGLRDG